jgi:molybdopterin synthase sulfur carrier subunit
MQIEVSLFGQLREAVGRKTVEREVAEGATVAEVVAGLVDDYDGLANYLDGVSPGSESETEPGAGDANGNGAFAGKYVVTVNRRHVQQLDGPDTVLSAGDVVRLAPPVYGGSRDGR